MTYQDTLNWMFSQLPMYQRQGVSAYKVDLSNTVLLINHLNNPHDKFKSVHVAGTNGKGSTSHMLASVLQESGYKVGLYTSPHLKDFRERIKINGKEVSEEFVVDFIKQNKGFFEANSLSFFEMTVGMAFDYFSQENVDIAIVEVGLGGRLDSTNVITPEVSVITNIGLDHTQFLGNTLEAIAFEKGGIIKKNVPVVIGETQQETEQVFKDLAQKQQSKIVFADQVEVEVLKSDLMGSYQEKNIKTVIQSVKELQSIGYRITNKNLKEGLLRVVNNTGLLGRWQILNTSPKVVCDTGHNKEGLTYVMNQLKNEVFNTLHIVFGVVNDKDLSTIVDLLPKNARYYFCKPNISRGLSAKVLKQRMAEYGLSGEAYGSVNEAYKFALKAAKKEDFIFVGGSTFVVAEII
ncbi:bifunctional folylpolyglutamate synthase/dihydrofolate synthase [Algibacter amylolyticus]|uniref:Dihydrofolate synthase/folylpolyglutamate synthase n=1 Tax=Algibacter amylolyticus TaxID=1608400 RepID=A0A5M7BFI1_9FLAO|nr:folylpolyglutamate synthase/dihydrofolate synthase family protein [Algibacter amylolyticus]KAA5828079.1 bifunctional folylpolyglutamate synthase/dihydrofolate synthase [Algibacter amylolyticus]MBB5267327.1 dihydrofolate synthase/folylpolyglutamate synthase [Algibacter amylolyticus]TSJ82324.1 bifunctional folylpolyglutamate synthase/dihydrofolate synthase [Algibacter amylolyticus]